MNEVDARSFVKEHLSQRAIILQLAEESAELSAAASKLVRVLDGCNPSPVSQEAARKKLLEEYGDVLDCIDILVSPSENAEVVDARMKKFVRWAGRIKARLEEGEHE